jgi:hypothetical protein
VTEKSITISKYSEEIYKAIEALNIENMAVKSSKEYKLGKRILKYINLLFRLGFKEIYKGCIGYYILRTEKKEVSPSIFIHKPPPGKVVVFACISGPYDLPQEPFCPEPGVDYILYTDQPQSCDDTVWQYRDIPDKVKELSSNGKVHNAYMRMHPFEFFSEYDYAVYVDGNMRIMSNVSAWANLISSNIGVAMHKHNTTQCLYKALKYDALLKKGYPKGLRNQMYHYRAEGMPHEYGMLESTVIATDLHNSTARKFCNLWWDEFIRWNSLRDQMSLGYVIWKMSVPIDDIGTLGGNVWQNPKLRRYPHAMKRYHVDKG